MSQLLQLQGVTYEDIQRMFEQAVKESYPHKPSLIYLDVVYLYTFEPSDLPFIHKFTDRMRAAQYIDKKGVMRNPLQIEWHRILERWYAGDYAIIDPGTVGKAIKPIQIERTIDRVVNEFMERIASAMAGFGDFAPMKFNAIGDGAVAGTAPSPGDTALVSELDRIDVTSQVGGGGLTVDGSTFMNVANFDRFSPSGDMTECGIFDAELPGAGEDDVPIIDDRMGDHSIFPNAVDHTSGQNAAGDSVIVYQCSS
jgi:hypothetical protein